MKKSLTIVSFALLNLAVFAQSPLTDSMENAQVKFYASNNGSFFRNPWLGFGGYVVPKDGLVSAISHMSILAVGDDANGQTHGAYGNINSSDFMAGPVADDYVNGNYPNYDQQLWQMTKAEVEYHMAHWSDQNYVPSNNIINWPGTGDITNGESQILAPFYDMDQNGIYDPTLGDYPIIRGDKAIYSIINDDRGYHYSGLTPMGIEVHLMLYMYESETDSILNQTVFVNTTVYNRSNTTYNDFYLGYDINFDLGSFDTDFLGTNTGQSIAYVYNGMLFDPNFYGLPGYGEYPPSVGFVALDHNLYSHISLDGTAALGTPEGLENSVKGLQMDGSPYLDDEGNPTTYLYTEIGLNDGSWNENNVGNPMGERESVVGFQPINLFPNVIVCYNSAIVYGRSWEGILFSSTEKMFENAAHIQEFYDAQTFGCGNLLGVSDQELLELSVYPNPVKGEELQIDGFITGDYEIWSSDGKLLAKGTLNAGVIPVSNISKGCYQLLVKEGTKVGRSSFIKQ